MKETKDYIQSLKKAVERLKKDNHIVTTEMIVYFQKKISQLESTLNKENNND